MEEKDTIDYIIEIFEQAKDLKKGQSKKIKCPKCGNKMFIQKSGYNGHMFAKCQTKDCITIIQ